MKLRLYVMDIRALERADLCARALRLLDPVRKEKAMRARNEKDRARSVGAGLLLLLGYAGMEGSMELQWESLCAGFRSASGSPNEDLQILSPAFIIQKIEHVERTDQCSLSEGIDYEISDQGRPAWKKPHGQYPYFNLSHSGNYAVLAIGDVPMGVDVQEPRRVLHQSIGNYQRFCRLESYLKCTGRGIDQKIEACYAKMEEAEKSGEYFLTNIPMPDEYALWICTEPGEKPVVKRNEKSKKEVTK